VRGCLPDHDAGVIDAMSRILEHAPNLEALSLAFHHHERDWGPHHKISGICAEQLLDAHHLGYNPHSVLAAPSAMIPCLRSRLREINLVHYQEGRVQRVLELSPQSHTRSHRPEEEDEQCPHTIWLRTPRPLQRPVCWLQFN
jgi:hypothetical protein